jgi:hypothetical protein
MFQAWPTAAEPLVDSIRDVFTRPTLRRFVLLMTGLIVTMGRRTVSRALVPIHVFMRGHWSDYHRLYSSARFSMWKLSAALVRQVIRLLPSHVVIELVADDTVVGKDGDHVWAKGVHRDSARSSRKVDQVKFGHKWLVMCVLVRLQGVARPWALPVLCGMCITRAMCDPIHAHQKTASDLARQLLIVLMRQLPNRKFILLGDYQVITHKTALFAHRHRDRVTPRSGDGGRPLAWRCQLLRSAQRTTTSSSRERREVLQQGRQAAFARAAKQTAHTHSCLGEMVRWPPSHGPLCSQRCIVVQQAPLLGGSHPLGQCEPGRSQRLLLQQ